MKETNQNPTRLEKVIGCKSTARINLLTAQFKDIQKQQTEYQNQPDK